MPHYMMISASHTGVWCLMSILQDVIPEAIPSHKCHLNMGPTLNVYGYRYLKCSMQMWICLQAIQHISVCKMCSHVVLLHLWTVNTFSLNMQCDINGDQLIGPYIFPHDIHAGFCKLSCQHFQRMLLHEHNYRCTNSMMEHPCISVRTSQSIWMSNSMTDGLAKAVCRMATILSLIDLHV